jgi:hypothetical protein
MKPDLSSEVLQAYLEAQIFFAGDLMAAFPPKLRAKDVARRNAELSERAAIAKRAGLSRKIVDLARKNRPILPEHQRRLWLALHVDPEAIFAEYGEGLE